MQLVQEETDEFKTRITQLNTVTATKLLATVFPPISFVVPGYIAQGLTILAGRPKTGKSWMALDLAVAVATGGKALGGIRVDGGAVLYLALEDNERRLKNRLAMMTPPGVNVDRLHLTTACPRLDDCGLEAIDAWCEANPNARCVIVDVFGKVRPERKGNEQLYESDYRALSPLKELADRRGIAIIAIHHTNKRTEMDDPFDAVSGTTGFTGVADTILVLARDSNGTTLYGRGRDIEEIETAVEFNHKTGQWRALGAANQVRLTDERQRILAVLRDADDLLNPATIALAAGMPGNNVRRLLMKMVKNGEVLKLKRGVYQHPDRTDLNDPLPPGNIGNKVTSSH